MYQLAVRDYERLPFKIVDKHPSVVQAFIELVNDLYHEYCLCKEEIPNPGELLEIETDWYPHSNETVNGFLDNMILEMMHRPNTFLDQFMADLPDVVDKDTVADFLYQCWDDIKPYYEDEVRIALEELNFSYKGEWGEIRNSHIIGVW